ncbi:hypothetical protein EVAR_68899_1 [Eumeta japonica]|uniref:Uncharacterized protein n=1 Tax=Eumeta variegata TaxID=151549 RepID=A0A4C1SFT8_EUMVA|nr:hypothetical protein EVAR_68899_1 [Eumeta japonica]
MRSSAGAVSQSDGKLHLSWSLFNIRRNDVPLPQSRRLCNSRPARRAKRDIKYFVTAQIQILLLLHWLFLFANAEDVDSNKVLEDEPNGENTKTPPETAEQQLAPVNNYYYTCGVQPVPVPVYRSLPCPSSNLIRAPDSVTITITITVSATRECRQGASFAGPGAHSPAPPNYNQQYNRPFGNVVSAAASGFGNALADYFSGGSRPRRIKHHNNNIPHENAEAEEAPDRVSHPTTLRDEALIPDASVTEHDFEDHPGYAALKTAISKCRDVYTISHYISLSLKCKGICYDNLTQLIKMQTGVRPLPHTILSDSRAYSDSNSLKAVVKSYGDITYRINGEYATHLCT